MDVALKYADKLNINNIRESKQDLFLQEIDKIGQSRIDNWNNMLILGDISKY